MPNFPNFSITLIVLQLEEVLQNGQWDTALSLATELTNERDVLRALVAGHGHEHWHEVFTHPILRVARSASLASAEWMCVFQDCLAHTDRDGLMEVLVPKAPRGAMVLIGRDTSALSVLLKHPCKPIREAGITAIAAARDIDPQGEDSSSVGSWRSAVRSLWQRIQRLPDPSKDITVIESETSPLPEQLRPINFLR